eukprot:326703-Amphidinium_carterae.1
MAQWSIAWRIVPRPTFREDSASRFRSRGWANLLDEHNLHVLAKTLTYLNNMNNKAPCPQREGTRT